jgi:hypothetical protein
MLFGRRSQNHSVNIGIGKGLLQPGVNFGGGIELAEGLPAPWIALADGVQVSEVEEIASQVLTPVATPGYVYMAPPRGWLGSAHHDPFAKIDPWFLDHVVGGKREPEHHDEEGAHATANRVASHRNERDLQLK